MNNLEIFNADVAGEDLWNQTGNSERVKHPVWVTVYCSVSPQKTPIYSTHVHKHIQ